VHGGGATVNLWTHMYGSIVCTRVDAVGIRSGVLGFLVTSIWSGEISEKYHFGGQVLNGQVYVIRN
jgi:hypothetical protein